jgi:diacylglycerol kinase family enzyme
VALDGEIELMTPPLEYRLRPAALRVIVPGQT